MSYRAGVVGLRQGVEFIEIFNSHQDVEVTAICDVDSSRLDEVGSRFGIEERYTDYADFVESDLDIVELSTPIQVHGEQAIGALQHGKHVLCQYIAADHASQARELIDAWRESGKKYMFIESDCYQRNNLLMMELAERGLLGEPIWGRGHYVHDCKALGYDEDGSLTWRGRLWKKGLGGLAVGVHTCMPLLRIFGERVESVYAIGSGPRQLPEFNWSETVRAVCRFPSGRWIEIEMDIFSKRPVHCGYFLQGSEGCFEVDRAYLPSKARNSWLTADQLVESYGLSLPSDGEGHRSAFHLCVDDFMRAVRSDNDPPYGIGDALHVTAIGWAADESLCTRKDAQVKSFDGL